MTNQSDLASHEVRKHFHRDSLTYLNHAAISPLSVPVQRAIADFIDERSEGGVVENYFDFQHVIDETLAEIGSVYGASGSELEFVPNTSHGLGILANGYSWKRGDRIAIPDCEFPTNVYPFLNLQSRGVEVDMIPTREGVVDINAMEDTLTPNTRLVAISWVQFLSGHRCDVSEIGRLCRSRDILLSVDAIQGAGALDILAGGHSSLEEVGIDFLACGGHKWHMACQGIGYVYVGPRAAGDIAPPVVGWLNGPVDWENLSRYDLAFHDDASRFRAGTLNCMGIVAFDAAIKVWKSAGIESAERRVTDLSSYLRQRLVSQGYAIFGDPDPVRGSGIVTVYHDKAEEVLEYFADRRIVVAVRDGKVRFSPTFYNVREELDLAVDALLRFDNR